MCVIHDHDHAEHDDHGHCGHCNHDELTREDLKGRRERLDADIAAREQLDRASTAR